METKHTPGEWYHVGGDDMRKAPYIRVKGDVLPGTMPVAEVSKRGSYSEQLANARLIAAAPALLAALEAIIGACDRSGKDDEKSLVDEFTHEMEEAARAAIAKATGAA